MNQINNESLLRMIELAPTDYLRLLFLAGAYYESIMDSEGQRLTPLVQGNSGYVSDHWINFAKVQRSPFLMNHLASHLLAALKKQVNLKSAIFCGLPRRGGSPLAYELARQAQGTFMQLGVQVYTQAVKNDDLKVSVEYLWTEHKPQPGDEVVLVDGVFTFEEVDKVMVMFKEAQARIIGVASFLSQHSAATLPSTHFGQIPFIYLVNKVMPEYPLNDSRVSVDISKNNIVTCPDGNFFQLRQAINKVGVNVHLNMNKEAVAT